MTKFEKLNQIVKKLRSPDGCDWDKEQTHESLMPYLLEEVYEVIEAIENKDFDLLKEELGDLLLHIVFQADLAKDKNKFSIEDSIDFVNKKLIDFMVFLKLVMLLHRKYKYKITYVRKSVLYFFNSLENNLLILILVNFDSLKL